MFVDDLESAQFYDALPRYGKEFYDYLYSSKIGLSSDSVIADIGCGTGRIAIDLLERGSFVYGVDPDENMRKICSKKCEQFKDKFVLVDGTDSSMNIPDKSVDFVIVSQSYHRFDPESFRSECNRVLKNPDNVLIFWYRVDYEAPIISEMLNSVKKHYSGYATRYDCDEVEGSKKEIAENNEIASEFFNSNNVIHNIPSKSCLTREEFLNLGLSLALLPITHEMNTISKVLNQPNFEKEAYISDLNDIFEKYQSNGVLTLKLNIQLHASRSLSKAVRFRESLD